MKYLHPADHNPKRITRAYRDFASLILKIYLQSKLEIFTKLKKGIKLVLVFLVMKIKEKIESMDQQNFVRKNMLLYY